MKYRLFLFSLMATVLSCSKSNDGAEPFVFVPEQYYIAGTVKFQGITGNFVPYMIAFNADGSARFRSYAGNISAAYRYQGGRLEVTYLGIQLVFDMNTVTDQGDIKTISSSKPNNMDVIYAVAQKIPEANLFRGKLFRGQIDSSDPQTYDLYLNFQPVVNTYGMTVTRSGTPVSMINITNDGYDGYTLFDYAAFMYKLDGQTHFGVMIDGYMEFMEHYVASQNPAISTARLSLLDK